MGNLLHQQIHLRTLDRINEGRLLSANQVGIVGNATGKRPDGFKQICFMVVHPDPEDIPANRYRIVHGKFLLPDIQKSVSLPGTLSKLTFRYGWCQSRNIDKGIRWEYKQEAPGEPT